MQSRVCATGSCPTGASMHPNFEMNFVLILFLFSRSRTRLFCSDEKEETLPSSSMKIQRSLTNIATELFSEETIQDLNFLTTNGTLALASEASCGGPASEASLPPEASQ